MPDVMAILCNNIVELQQSTSMHDIIAYVGFILVSEPLSVHNLIQNHMGPQFMLSCNEINSIPIDKSKVSKRCI